MSDHEIVLDLDGLGDLERLIRREIARDIAVLRNRPRFVEGRPLLHAVAERFKADFGIVDEFVNELPVQPVPVLKIYFYVWLSQCK